MVPDKGSPAATCENAGGPPTSLVQYFKDWCDPQAHEIGSNHGELAHIWSGIPGNTAGRRATHRASEF
jgi:hypothetical protein